VHTLLHPWEVGLDSAVGQKEPVCEVDGSCSCREDMDCSSTHQLALVSLGVDNGKLKSAKIQQFCYVFVVWEDCQNVIYQ
jgi:hypothetical protein